MDVQVVAFVAGSAWGPSPSSGAVYEEGLGDRYKEAIVYAITCVHAIRSPLLSLPFQGYVLGIALEAMVSTFIMPGILYTSSKIPDCL